MSGSRSWNRREASVAQAGYFTLLRSTGWFSALSRLPGGYRYVITGPATPGVLVKPEGAAAESPEKWADDQETAPTFQMVMPAASGRGLLRVALLALAAAGLTALFFLLLHLDR